MSTFDDRFPLRPVALVRGPRKEPVDDFWGGEIATLEFDPAQFGPEALAGLDAFSHLEVVFVMDRVTAIETGARHPRGREDWPRVGIFAQRASGRPNRIGLSRCRIVDVVGLSVRVDGLDAVDGTPVLDVKPWLSEFGPRGRVTQPSWSTELMTDYWTPHTKEGS